MVLFFSLQLKSPGWSTLGCSDISKMVDGFCAAPQPPKLGRLETGTPPGALDPPHLVLAGRVFQWRDAVVCHPMVLSHSMCGSSDLGHF